MNPALPACQRICLLLCAADILASGAKLLCPLDFPTRRFHKWKPQIPHWDLVCWPERIRQLLLDLLCMTSRITCINRHCVLAWEHVFTPPRTHTYAHVDPGRHILDAYETLHC